MKVFDRPCQMVFLGACGVILTLAWSVWLGPISRASPASPAGLAPAPPPLASTRSFWPLVERPADFLLAAAVVAALSAGWACAMRKKVLQKTSEMERRLAAEESLKQQYEEIFLQATDIIYTHDLNGGFLSVNPAGLALTGYSADEVLKTNIRDVVVPEFLGRVMAGIQARVAGQPVATREELDIRCKDGRVVSLEISGRLVLKDGHPFAIQGVARDITERKRQEQRRACLVFLGQKLSSTNSPKDAASVIADASDALLGWDSFNLDLQDERTGAMTTLLMIDIIGGQRTEGGVGDSLPPTERALRVMARGGELILRPGIPTFDPDGLPMGDTSRPSASLMLVPIRQGDKAVGLLSLQSYTPNAYQQADLETLQTLADFCAGALKRIEAEEARRSSEVRFVKAFQATPVALAIATAQGHQLRDINQSFLDLFRLERDQVIGKVLEELPIWAPGHLASILFSKAEGGNPVRNFPFRFRRADGDSRDTLASLEPLKQGEEECVLLIVLDLTERLKLEGQLRHAQKMEAIGQLAAGIAHDFNNILTIVQGHVNLALSEESITGEIRESMVEVSAAADRASHLTRQLLTFSRKQSIKARPVNLNVILEQSSKLLARVLGGHIDLECRTDPQLPMVMADGGMMDQIITNLAVNARDAMPQGGRLILSSQAVIIHDHDTGAHPQARPGAFVQIMVSDSGLGMNSELLARIFEPFFTTKENGTGLGLATVYAIVQRHEGWVEVESSPGLGTTFRVLLPALAQRAEELPAPQPRRHRNGGDETVLVVEDEPALRKLVSRLLVSQGYRVLSAADAQEALRIWDESGHQVDLLLTDLMMPGGLMGRDLAELLLQRRPSLKVIYTSGYSVEANDGSMVLTEGVNFLPKPFRPSVLTDIVRRRLDEVERGVPV